MSNLQHNPKPQYEGKNEDTIVEKSTRVNKEEYISNLFRIIRKNNELEKQNKDEQK